MRLAQFGQPDLQAVRRLVGRMAWPQLLDQPIRRNDLIGVHEQDSQHGPGAGPCQLERLAADRDLERAEYAELHPSSPTHDDAPQGRPRRR